jgi:hypothetical protein
MEGTIDEAGAPGVDLVDGGRQYIEATRRFWRAAAEARALTRGAMPRAGADEPHMQAPATPSEGH